MELDIRGRNVSLTDPLAHLVRRRLDFALGRHASEIRRVEVKLADVNGPRGGVDKECRVEVVLSHGGSVAAHGIDEHVRNAIDRAAHRAGRRVNRKLARVANSRRGERLSA
ncbi:MAG: HPF/RaiA family ribosome-associated protein [Deltaproteobacteria bacterium]|nr:HPF/RaiA family ribosome-associated protein [Deltaproteobacteria bacterium]